MATFPILKTGAVAQYPSSREIVSRSRVMRFVDGSEQRFQTEAAYRRWSIEFDLLDESEAAAVVTFAQQVQGMSQVFAFTDPWTGIVYPRCRLADDVVVLSLDGGHRARTRLSITEAGN